MTTEEPIIIEEAPKRDFYYAFADEAAAATALEPFYHQPQLSLKMTQQCPQMAR